MSDVSKPIIGPVIILLILFFIVFTITLFCKGAFSSLRPLVVSSLIFSLVIFIEFTNSFNVVSDELLSREELILNELVVVLAYERVNPSYKSSMELVLLDIFTPSTLNIASAAAVACCALFVLLSKVDNPASPDVSVRDSFRALF